MKKHILTVLALTTATSLLAKNLLFNNDFSLGTNGYALQKTLRLDTNPNLTFIPLTVEKDEQGPVLSLDNTAAEIFHIFTKECKLEPKTQYKLTGAVKSTRPGERISFRVFKVDPKWSAQTRTVKTTQDWQTFTLVFKTDERGGYHHLRICIPEKGQPESASFKIRQLRLEKVGDTSPDQIMLTVAPKENLVVAKPNTTFDLTLFASNPTTLPYNETVRVTATDDYTKRILFTKDIPLSLKPGEAKEIPFQQKADRFGGFRITATAKNLFTHDGFVAIIGEYVPQKIDITKDYVLGFNGGIYYQLDPQVKHPGYMVFDAPFAKNLHIYSKIGVRIIREHDAGVRSTDWTALEPEQGKLDFTHLDRSMALYEKYNIVPFPVIGGTCCIDNSKAHQAKNLPDWVEARSERVKEDPPNCMEGVKGHIILPPVDLFANHVREIARHIKGRVPVYEIMNEPNLYLAADAYVSYLKHTYKAIKEEDPNAVVSGYCLTSDFGAAATPWMQQCVKLEGLNYVDVIGFHPYRGRELGSLKTADGYIKALRDEMASYGKPNIPLWNTELYYLIDQDPNAFYVDQQRCKPHHAVWRFLVDLGEGIVQSISIHHNQIWKTMLTPNMLAGNNFHQYVLSEVGVAYNAVARLFERAKPVAKYKLPNGTICYVYRKDGKLIAAIWNYEKKKGVSADLSKFNVMDIYGNPVPAETKTIADMPYYLTQAKLSEQDFLDKLKNLTILLDNPISIGQLARTTDASMHIVLYNDSNKPQKGIVGITGGGYTAMRITDFEIKPMDSIQLEIPVKKTQNDGNPTQIMLRVNGTITRTPVLVVPNKTIGKTFKMPNATGTIQLQKNLVKIEMDVQDTTNAGPTGKRNIWETDCVEFFFDTNPCFIPKAHAQAYTKDTFRLFVTPRDEKTLHTMGNITADACNLKIDATPTGYKITLDVKVETRGILGFDVKIDDADGDKISETTLGDGKHLHKNRCFFNLVR